MQDRSTLLHSLHFLCLGMISISTAFSQTPSHILAAKPAPPIDYVYIAQQATNTGPNQVLGYSVAANGKLTPIKGSPFAINAWTLAVNGKYLFAGTGGYPDNSGIDTYAIEPGGGLKFVVANTFPDLYTNSWGAFFLSHTGQTLYGQVHVGGSEDMLASFSIDKRTGIVSLTQTDYPARYETSFTLSADNKHIYVAAPEVDGSEVVTLDTENWNQFTDPIPNAPPPGYFNPLLFSADPTNHVAGLFASSCYWCGDPTGYIPTVQLGVYTADANGNLTMNGTYKNMPKLPTFMGGASDLKMSASGKLLAVSGGAGLQVFHFNGSKPITPYATLVKTPSPLPTTVPAKQLGWDNHDHMFTLFANKLYVFTVTPTSVTQAPGSPYAISGFPGAQWITVQPLL